MIFLIWVDNGVSTLPLHMILMFSLGVSDERAILAKDLQT